MHIVIYFSSLSLIAIRIIMFGPNPADYIDMVLLVVGMLSVLSLMKQLEIVRKVYNRYMDDYVKEKQRREQLEVAITHYMRLEEPIKGNYNV